MPGAGKNSLPACYVFASQRGLFQTGTYANYLWSLRYGHSTRFASPMQQNIADTELVIFEGCAHAPIYKKVDEFNQTTLTFLQRHSG